MARYQIPPDPRQEPPKKKQRRERPDTPWGWLAGGVLVAVLSVWLAVAIGRAFLLQPPLEVALPDPTLIVLTAPPSATPTATPRMATPTAVATFTPIPTPDIFIAPEEITAGYYAQVGGTAGAGVRVRGGPSVNNVVLDTAAESAYLLVLDGPAEGDGFIWWQVRLENDTEGWTVADYLTPVAAPPGTPIE